MNESDVALLRFFQWADYLIRYGQSKTVHVKTPQWMDGNARGADGNRNRAPLVTMYDQFVLCGSSNDEKARGYGGDKPTVFHFCVEDVDDFSLCDSCASRLREWRALIEDD